MKIFFIQLKKKNFVSKIIHSDEHEKTLSSRKLIGFVEGEIKSVKTCADCYEHANIDPDNWFTKTCTEPHLLIWAKIKGYSYWPAKVMSVDGQGVNVRFFGDHTNASVPASNCNLFSQQNPDKNRSMQNKSSYITALKVS